MFAIQKNFIQHFLNTKRLFEHISLRFEVPLFFSPTGDSSNNPKCRYVKQQGKLSRLSAANSCVTAIKYVSAVDQLHHCPDAIRRSVQCRFHSNVFQFYNLYKVK